MRKIVLIFMLGVFGATAADQIDVKEGRELIQKSDGFKQLPLESFPGAYEAWQKDFLNYIRDAKVICERKSEGEQKSPDSQARTLCFKRLKQLNLTFVDQSHLLRKWFLKQRLDRLQTALDDSHRKQVAELTKIEP